MTSSAKYSYPYRQSSRSVSAKCSPEQNNVLTVQVVMNKMQIPQVVIVCGAQYGEMEKNGATPPTLPVIGVEAWTEYEEHGP